MSKAMRGLLVGSLETKGKVIYSKGIWEVLQRLMGVGGDILV